MDNKDALAILNSDILTIKETIKIYEYQYYTWRCLINSCEAITDENFEYFLKEMNGKLDEISDIINEIFDKDLDVTDDDLDKIVEKYNIAMNYFGKNFDDAVENTYKTFIKEHKKKKQ